MKPNLHNLGTDMLIGRFRPRNPIPFYLEEQTVEIKSHPICQNSKKMPTQIYCSLLASQTPNKIEFRGMNLSTKIVMSPQCKYIAALLTIIFMLCQFTFAGPICVRYLSNSAADSPFEIYLPSQDSAEFQTLSRSIRRQIDENRHFAIVDLSRWFTPQIRMQLFKDKLDAIEFNKNETSYQLDNMSEGARENEARLEFYAKWVRALVATTLEIEKQNANFRTDERVDFAPENFEGYSPNLRPHFDRGLFNTVLTLEGLGTRVLKVPSNGGQAHVFSINELASLNQTNFTADQYITLRPGELLVLAGNDQYTYNPPLHWRPKYKGGRYSWIVQFF